MITINIYGEEYIVPCALDGRTGATSLDIKRQSSFSTTAISAAFICIPQTGIRIPYLQNIIKQ
jgi:hypothetical protein